MIELAHAILEGKKQATAFSDMVQEIATTLELSQEAVHTRLAQFYTDINVDGRFISVGENRWGLRSWYPYEQMEEEILPQAKPKKKRKYDEEDLLDDYVAEDEDFEDIDELDDLDVIEEDEFVDEDEVDEFDDEIVEDEDELAELDEEEELEEEEEAEFEEEEEEEI
ncbi:DNA-directed RNA polymerase subunit delta [Ectobacillus ponti]|uniref:Probable DNA-directed RNA polymerase subunit delta n=1 Tax=Ectobacillus ponti TaxID=2961894 RepID=A0AA41X6X8_9BACI|nr:DNA-directed RNA polymerase subunit delta [Ectobacillus ponti]MCP8967955.1 DNA-directed RNA polymerase subunit delta [Ectobacillus ponti]